MSEEEMEKEENLEHEVLDRLWLMTENDFNKDILDESYIDAMLKARNIILKLYKKQEKVINKMTEHTVRVIINDDNASLLPFCDSEDNLEEKVKEYFYKEAKDE